MKPCPYCAETIEDHAQVCPFCHTNLAAPVAAPGMQSTPGPGNATTSGKAIASLVCGIAGFVIPILSAVVAIVLGHLSLSEIRKSGGRLKGQGMAVAGLVLGYVGVAFLPFVLIIAAIAIPNLLRAKIAANEASAVGALRSYDFALGTYVSQCPKTGFPLSLVNLGPGSGRPDCNRAHLLDGVLSMKDPARSGYTFRYTPGPLNNLGQITSFTIAADPTTEGTTGMRHFFTDQTEVIRYSATGPADADSPPLQ